MSGEDHFPGLLSWSAMNFTRNCSVWGEWFATYVSPSPWNSTWYLDGDVRAIFQLFEWSTPDNWSVPEDRSYATYYGQVLDWYGFNFYSALYGNATLADLEAVPENETSYLINSSHPFFKNLVSDPSHFCKKERCIAIGWIGDMDLVGIGVFTSYYVEAVLATILLFAYSYWRFRQPLTSCKNLAPNEKKSRRRDRLIVGLQESLQYFLDASALFSIAMLVAALYLSGRGIKKHNEHLDVTADIRPPKTALYDMLLSMLASTFSIFPVMIAYTIKRRDPPGSINYKRRPIWLGIATLLLVWILSVMEAFMSLYGNYDYEYGTIIGEIDGDPYENCDWRGSVHYSAGMKAAQSLLLFCPLFLVLVTGFLITGFGFSGVVDKPLIVRCRRLWRLVIAWIQLLAMWGILGFFTWVRHRIDTTVGHLNESNEWRFGQWLALFTWIPFVLHVLHRWINGTDSEHEQHEQTRESLQKSSDGTSISTQTLNSPPLNPSGYAAVPAQGRATQIESLSTDTSFPLNSEYSSTLYRCTTSGRDPVEEWQTTGW